MKKTLAVLLLVSKAVFAVTLGTLATVCLFYVMQALIAHGERVVTKAEPIKMVEMLRVKEERFVQLKQRMPERPPPPDELPPAPQEQLHFEAPQNVGYQLSTAAIKVTHTMEIGTTRYATSDRDYLPLVKVEPAYPIQAAAKNLVGWVIVEYTVTSHGTVRDPVVIANCAIPSPNEPERECEGHPSSVFNDAAIRAALKFKYTPKTIDGVPIDTEGVRNYFSFRFNE